MHTTYADLLGTWSNRPLLMPLQIAGAVLDNYYAKRAAKKSRDWQEEMSNTAYQRAMTDMRKAGLNPILAYKQGGAGTPPGATAATPGFSQAAGQTGSRVMQALRLKSEVDNIQANTGKAVAETAFTDKKAELIGPGSSISGAIEEGIIEPGIRTAKDAWSKFKKFYKTNKAGYDAKRARTAKQALSDANARRAARERKANLYD